ncbi:hypothetical protein EDB92DRAFT_2037872 [Lactarius akahatsu]|uniref:Uncharacterized protein n=1 Tax=Lactarius akahatsu TaxID=416441 RepID=A0AAD4L7I3_9AGAM|nr:hypothetical protein EDB92DRAFT_2037872 [Lactarius akahatsu]
MSSESACSATVVSVCGMERIAEQEKRVVYSFGINGESLFEAALLECVPGREAWGYELPWTACFGPEIDNTPNLKERAHFFPWALAGRSAHGTDLPKYYTLDALMQPDRIDIERAEFDTLTAFLAANKSPHPFCTTLPIELHAWYDYAKFYLFHDWWAALEATGRPFWTEVKLKLNPGGKPKLAEHSFYSFMNIRGNPFLV